MGTLKQIIVVGRGPAGLYLSTLALAQGVGVTVIADGLGSCALWGGHWDFVSRDEQGHVVQDPWRWWEGRPPVPEADPVPRSVWRAWWQDLARFWRQLGIVPDHEPPRTNRWLVTPVGTVRPVFLAPQWHWAEEEPRPVTLVGFHHFIDFPVEVAAQNYQQETGCRAEVLVLPHPPLWTPAWQPLQWAWYFDTDPGREWLKDALRAASAPASLPLVFPQILGVDRVDAVFSAIQAALGVAVGEIPLTPPSVGGLRVQRRWERWLRRRGLRLWSAHAVRATATSVELEDGRMLTADAVVLATGGILGGGIQVAVNGAATDPLTGVDLGQATTPRDLGRLGYPRPEMAVPVVGRQVGGRDCDRQGMGGAMILWSGRRVWRHLEAAVGEEAPSRHEGNVGRLS